MYVSCMENFRPEEIRLKKCLRNCLLTSGTLRTDNPNKPHVTTQAISRRLDGELYSMEDVRAVPIQNDIQCILLSKTDAYILYLYINKFEMMPIWKKQKLNLVH